MPRTKVMVRGLVAFLISFMPSCSRNYHILLLTAVFVSIRPRKTTSQCAVRLAVLARVFTCDSVQHTFDWKAT